MVSNAIRFCGSYNTIFPQNLLSCDKLWQDKWRIYGDQIFDADFDFSGATLLGFS